MPDSFYISHSYPKVPSVNDNISIPCGSISYFSDDASLILGEHGYF